jgi:myosin-crossreactive antigen
MPGDANKKAYIIGGGIAGLATAVFLITDGDLRKNGYKINVTATKAIVNL